MNINRRELFASIGGAIGVISIACSPKLYFFGFELRTFDRDDDGLRGVLRSFDNLLAFMHDRGAELFQDGNGQRVFLSVDHETGWPRPAHVVYFTKTCSKHEAGQIWKTAASLRNQLS